MQRIETRMNVLLLTGLPLSENAQNDICYAMARAQKKSFDLRTDEMEGRIETNWSTGGMGHIWGIMFSAKMDTTLGTTTIRFIISTTDLNYFQQVDMESLRVEWEAPAVPQLRTN